MSDALPDPVRLPPEPPSSEPAFSVPLEWLNRLEAALMVAEQPLSELQLLQALPPDCSTQQLQQCLTALQHRHAQHAVYLRQSASGWQLAVRAAYADAVAGVWPERPQRLSAALLETLSVIAYRQPVTRSDIEQVRGVTLNSAVLRQLFERGWIREQGHREVPGRPALLVTTRQFLDDFGLSSLAQLPPLSAELLASIPSALTTFSKNR